MLLSCIARCCMALWCLLQRADSSFHLFIFRHDWLFLHCNLHKKHYPSPLPSLCSPPTHIYRHAATDKLNLDSAVAKLPNNAASFFISLWHSFSYSHPFLFSPFSAPHNFSQTPLQFFLSHFESVEGWKRELSRQDSPTRILKKD